MTKVNCENFNQIIDLGTSDTHFQYIPISLTHNRRIRRIYAPLYTPQCDRSTRFVPPDTVRSICSTPVATTCEHCRTKNLS